MLLLSVALVALIALSIWQAYGFMRYSSLAASIRADERNAQVESEALGRRLAELDERLNRPEATLKMSEIQFLNNIIARKAFSWTRVFSDLEELMPESVHLVSLRPDISDNGPAVLHIEVQAHTVQDWAKFAESLQSVPAFDDVIVSTEEKRPGSTAATSSDVNISFSVKYHPEREGQ